MFTTRPVCKSDLLPRLQQNLQVVQRPAPILPHRQFHQSTTNSTTSRHIPKFATKFQANNIYTDRFPCTLHYYSSGGPKLRLYDQAELHEGDGGDVHRLAQDAVTVDDKAVVDPASTSSWSACGATMYPNTLLMLQITRSFSDWAQECKSKGEDMATPWFFIIPKGEPRAGDLFGKIHSQVYKFGQTKTLTRKPWRSIHSRHPTAQPSFSRPRGPRDVPPTGSRGETPSR